MGGAHDELTQALQELHTKAGRPSLRVVSKAVADNGLFSEMVSHDTVGQMLRGTGGVPRWRKLECVVVVLVTMAGTAPGSTAAEDVGAARDRFHALWQAADDARIDSAVGEAKSTGVHSVPAGIPPLLADGLSTAPSAPGLETVAFRMVATAPMDDVVEWLGRFHQAGRLSEVRDVLNALLCLRRWDWDHAFAVEDRGMAEEASQILASLCGEHAHVPQPAGGALYDRVMDYLSRRAPVLQAAAYIDWEEPHAFLPHISGYDSRDLLPLMVAARTVDDLADLLGYLDEAGQAARFHKVSDAFCQTASPWRACALSLALARKIGTSRVPARVDDLVRRAAEG